VWEKHGEAAAEASFKKGDRKNRPQAKSMPKFRYVVRGKIQYLGSVKGWHHQVYRRLAKRLAALDTDFKPTTRPSIWPPMPFLVFCEGKTDYTHLRTALQRLRVDGLYPEIDLDFQIHHAKGDQDLLTRCKMLAGTHHAVSCVFIFDRDSAQVVAQVEDAGSYKNWGNGVYSFALPVPLHRDPSFPLCVELLYEDSILKTADSEGRRVFARSEFDPSTGAHATKDVYCPHPNSKSVILEMVIDFATKKNVALSKSAFSDLVAAEEKPFDAVDFGGFVPVFQVFQRIREQILHDV
jgi:RNA-directed DNA polymerase